MSSLNDLPTAFDKTQNWNLQFGVLKEILVEPMTDILGRTDETSVALVENCMRLIREEVKELSEAVSSNDLIETADALGDIIFVVHGMCCRLGIRFDRVFRKTWGLESAVGSEFEIVRTNLGDRGSIYPTSSQMVERIVQHVKELDATIQSRSSSISLFEELVRHLVELAFDCYHFGLILRFDMDRIYDQIYLNNMEKLCGSEAEASETIRYYEQNPQLGYTEPVARIAPDMVHWVVYNRPTLKVLKSISWKPVDLSWVVG